TFGPAIYYEVNFRLEKLTGVKYKVVEETLGLGNVSKKTTAKTFNFTDVLNNQKERILIPIDTSFGILIPKIGANARVFPNVDPSSPDKFLPFLQQGVAHAKGTVFPGQKGNIYLFAHSTDNFWNVGRYNAIFYLLKDLGEGDDVVVFYQNVRHNYTVTKSVIADPTDVSYIADSQTGKELLILQTCWPPGTTWQRLIVFATPK
ncbi:MAG: class E sortase, partial [Candidatus Levybacteria bacterium]|nr:class E sortase [Candidatus Levybacteria bacterium]